MNNLNNGSRLVSEGAILGSGIKHRKKNKLTDDQVKDIKVRLLNGDKQKDIAKDYKVSVSLVNKINTGATYSYIFINKDDK